MRGMLWMIERAHTLAEGAGAAALAGAYRMRDELRGKKVGIICSGGNTSLEHLRLAARPVVTLPPAGKIMNHNLYLTLLGLRLIKRKAKSDRCTILQARKLPANRGLQSAWRCQSDLSTQPRRTRTGRDRRLYRKPRAVCGLCGKIIWCESAYCGS